MQRIVNLKKKKQCRTSFIKPIRRTNWLLIVFFPTQARDKSRAFITIPLPNEKTKNRSGSNSRKPIEPIHVRTRQSGSDVYQMDNDRLKIGKTVQSLLPCRVNNRTVQIVFGYDLLRRLSPRFKQIIERIVWPQIYRKSIVLWSVIPIIFEMRNFKRMSDFFFYLIRNTAVYFQTSLNHNTFSTILFRFDGYNAEIHSRYSRFD